MRHFPSFWLALALSAACQPSAPATPASPGTVAPPTSAPSRYQPQDVPEDRPNTQAAEGPPTAADPLLVRIDVARDSARAKLPPVRRDDAGTPLPDPKAGCVSGLVMQIESARRGARDKRAALQSDIQRHDDAAAQREMVTISLLAEHAEQLAREASRCP